MTEMREEIDLIELDGLDFDIVCQPWRRTCDRKAEWMMIKACCGAEFPYCDMHVVKARDEIKRIVSQDKDRRCLLCGSRRSTSGNHDWYRMVKL